MSKQGILLGSLFCLSSLAASVSADSYDSHTRVKGSSTSDRDTNDDATGRSSGRGTEVSRLSAERQPVWISHRRVIGGS